MISEDKMMETLVHWNNSLQLFVLVDSIIETRIAEKRRVQRKDLLEIMRILQPHEFLRSRIALITLTDIYIRRTYNFSDGRLKITESDDEQ